MIKESGKMVKRGGERVLSGLEFLATNSVRLKEMIFPPRGGVRGRETHDNEAASAVSIGSMVIHVGPVPDELRKDPFPGGSVPWSIIEGEKEKRRIREMAILKVAIGVSWVIAAVAALRALGML